VTRQGICFVLSAPSGGGKTTLIREMLKLFPDMRHSISYTTRPRRNDHSDHTDYHFVSDESFAHMIENDEFLEWADVHGYRYGTSRHDLTELLDNGHDVLMDIDVQGSLKLMSTFRKAVFIFILPPSIQILENRLRRRRSESDESLSRRLKNAVQEVKAYFHYDYIMINDELDDSIERLKAVITAEHSRTQREGVQEMMAKWLEDIRDE
jgi:guanylate kinase